VLFGNNVERPPETVGEKRSTLNVLSLTVELVRRVSISSDALVISCLYSGISLLDFVL